MTKKEFIKLLEPYPDDIPMRLLLNSSSINSPIHELESDHLLYTSETAYINEDAPEEEWDTDEGKIEHGNGPFYLLLNPIIV